MNQSNVKVKKYQKSIQLINASDNDKLVKALDSLFNSFLDWNFCGLYFKNGDKLEVSTYFSDKIPCSPIEMNGVCGQAITKNSILIVKDVSKFDNHIVCDINSKSEIAIPFTKDKKEFVLDIDSKKQNDFDEVDIKYLKEILKII
jgi:L-methionine (R)-S-oxide reductase|tara:strand:+ start:954 stop:1388 length:435 start_codon:yes stop_codon:yes gene_type:complete